ncbi:hypothetical protein R5W24_002127 [Gemmata sp. JC717]|uniref:hypothetical protein n=1 Tax=Gemmata algarum TaxID=2975278 RepID=UPI0021BB4EC0|nr:hypothetical protein [Gemmata algarum]MDY3553037.1 hypothetical protein [Gemmata algarum]
MTRYVLALPLLALVLGCGGGDLPTTSDPDAIKREQERLSGGAGGGPKSAPKGAKDDAIRREQERLGGKGGR